MAKRIFAALLITQLAANLHGQGIVRIDGSNVSTDSLHSHFERLQNEANVHGLTISILSAERVLFQESYGSKNIKEGLPLETSHNFYGASLSKPLFGYIVMNLVDQGLIDLDRPLVEYLDAPLPSYSFKHDYEGYDDLEGDERYKQITARMCLSHTSGLPNWRYITRSGIKMGNPLAFEFDPGATYSYSGEGIQLLQFVVEQITGQQLEELAQAYVFKPFDMPMSSFLWQERFEGNYAVGHYKKKKTLERKKRNEQYAAGSMDTTPEDYANFIQAMLAKKGLSVVAFNEMVKPQVEIHSLQQFGRNRFKTNESNRKIELSYGLGWGLYQTPYGKAVFKEGHIEGWEHYAIFYPSHNLGVVIMTNSSNGESIFKEVLEIAMGDIWMPWYWENYFPYNFRDLKD